MNARACRGALAPVPGGLAAAGQGGADGGGNLLQRGDRPVREAHPDRRDPVGGEHQELQPVAVEAPAEDPVYVGRRVPMGTPTVIIGWGLS
jgi:hypothetical protein